MGAAGLRRGKIRRDSLAPAMSEREVAQVMDPRPARVRMLPLRRSTLVCSANKGILRVILKAHLLA
eukprot:scaffold203259_cov47-Prasinocladus_malaysianus.AAC.2